MIRKFQTAVTFHFFFGDLSLFFAEGKGGGWEFFQGSHGFQGNGGEFSRH